jgi:3-methyladenine DNA glycosylase AlkD
MQHHLKEIEQKLNPYAAKVDKPYADFRKLCTNYDVSGIRLPQLREVFQEGFSFSDLPHDEQVPIWDYVWKHSNNHEVMQMPLFYFEARAKKNLNTLKDWKALKTWIDQIDGWEHGDRLAAIYAVLYEYNRDALYPVWQKWNKNKNPWKRRNGLLALIYYASPKRTYPPLTKVLPLVKPLITDPDPYIQKAVGWTLRECYKLYPQKTYQFLTKEILNLSATAFSYSTEKLTGEEKQILKQRRKSKKRSATVIQ